jgi:hypothetical protein
MTVQGWMDEVDEQIGILMRAAAKLSRIEPGMSYDEARTLIGEADDITDGLKLRDLCERLGWSDGDDY